jgi:hypothetical protein
MIDCSIIANSNQVNPELKPRLISSRLHHCLRLTSRFFHVGSQNINSNCSSNMNLSSSGRNKFLPLSSSLHMSQLTLHSTSTAAFFRLKQKREKNWAKPRGERKSTSSRCLVADNIENLPEKPPREDAKK